MKQFLGIITVALCMLVLRSDLQAQMYPVVAGTTTSAKTSTSSTTHNVSLPSGIQAGDLLLVFWTDNTTSTTVGTPSGWISLYSDVSGGRTRAAWYKIASGSEGPSLSLSLSGSSLLSAHNSYRIAAGSFQGVPVAASEETGTNSSPNPPGLSPSWGSYKTLWLAASHSEGNSSGSAPSGYSELITGYTGSTGSSHARTMTARFFSESASENPGSFSLGNNRNWAANTVAIQGPSGLFRTRAAGAWNNSNTWEEFADGTWTNTANLPNTPTMAVHETFFPVIAGTANSAKTSQTGTVHSIALPINIQAGDLLLVFWVDENSSGTAPATPAGFTQLYTNTSSSRVRRAWYKIATGSEGAFIDVTGGAERSAHVAYRIAAGSYQGVPQAGSVQSDNEDGPNPPNLSPSWGLFKTMWIAASHSEGYTSTVGLPSNYSDRIQSNTGSTGSSHATMVTGTRFYEAAAENPGSFSMSGDRHWAANTVAIQGSEIVDEVPQGVCNVVIRNGHSVSLTADIVIDDITIDAGATLNAGSATVTMMGNWENNGTFNAQTSTFVMGGSSAQTMKGSTFYNLEIDNAGGVTLLSDETIANTLTLTEGVVTTGEDHQLIVTNTNPGAVVIGAGSINGTIRRAIGNGIPGTYRFTDYYTFMILNNSQSAQDVTVTSYPGEFPSPIGNPGAAIKRYYEITATSLMANTLSLAFINGVANENPNNIDTMDIAVFRLRPGTTSWENYGPFAGTNVSASAFSVSDWSTKFSLGNGFGALPVQLASFTGAVVNNNNVRLDWRTISEVN
ncbi:MAG: hypothetical protein KIT50_15875, partial [Bacteroidetes bacterium]|nr:hypothetical protein [Bacteroidota bacterium]